MLKGKTMSRNILIWMSVVGLLFFAGIAQAQERNSNPGDLNRNTHACNSDHPELPCYYEVYGSGPSPQPFSVPGLDNNITPQYSQVIVCGVKVYNGLNQEVGKLQETVTVDWSTGRAAAPATIDAATRSGTYAAVNYSWKSLNGPVVNPGLGQESSDTLTSTLSGIMEFNLDIFDSYEVNYTVKLTINPGGWYCS